MKKRKPSFKQLMMVNREEIISDLKAIEKIETKIEDRQTKRLQQLSR